MWAWKLVPILVSAQPPGVSAARLDAEAHTARRKDGGTRDPARNVETRALA
jgi:hypothetical protein